MASGWTPVRAEVVEVVIPGHSDPWLAGMPDGATASCCYGGILCDSSPSESPEVVAGLHLEADVAMSFNVTGGTAQDPYYPLEHPDGGYVTPHEDGEDNGISTFNGPISSCIGVFLNDDQPDHTPAPEGLDFGTPESRDYLTLSPLLKQVFFIGDGLTSNGVQQQIIVPEGATRLYLGPMDSCEWSNNIGQFEVVVTNPIEPSSVRIVSWSAIRAQYR
ncbi:MAG: PEP-CTERM sorting domain-containing protein [Candidatus Eisenbacteria bacterium]